MILNHRDHLHEISKINPIIPVIKNNNLVFNTGDASLSGYNLKIFYDNQFNNELVSIGSTLNFQCYKCR